MSALAVWATYNAYAATTFVIGSLAVLRLNERTAGSLRKATAPA